MHNIPWYVNAGVAAFGFLIIGIRLWLGTRPLWFNYVFGLSAFLNADIALLKFLGG